MEQPDGSLASGHDSAAAQGSILDRKRPTSLPTSLTDSPRVRRNIELFISEESDSNQDSTINHHVAEQRRPKNCWQYKEEEEKSSRDDLGNFSSRRDDSGNFSSSKDEPKNLSSKRDDSENLSSRRDDPGNLSSRKDDSGNFSFLAEHINRNILACFICSAKFVNPKVQYLAYIICYRTRVKESDFQYS
jgi:hypothetical protein